MTSPSTSSSPWPSAIAAAAAGLGAGLALGYLWRGGERDASSPSQISNKKMSAEEYFRSTEPPKDLESVRSQMEEFVRSAMRDGKKRVVCITGGGTTVPLEKNTVRFIDNFSTGTRAATSAEYFLKKGYCVLYLRRRGSTDAFARHLQTQSKHLDSRFIETLQIDDAKGGMVSLKISPKTVQMLQEYQRVKKEGLLLSVEFSTCDEYFFYLREAAKAVELAKSRGMMYLAAAVSDFFMGPDMPTHKIQSSHGPLTLNLQQTPKLLGELRRSWAPSVVCVSFKLETDAKILITKAERAIKKYGMDAVVANELHTRYDQVRIVTGIGKVDLLTKDSEADTEIEDAIIDYLDRFHAKFVL